MEAINGGHQWSLIFYVHMLYEVSMSSMDTIKGGHLWRPLICH
jgi:hypothetical protein